MSDVVGTVISDQETPNFETVRIKLMAGKYVKPGTLLRIPISRPEDTALIARVRSAYENNPNERAEDINVRDTLGIRANYPSEEDSTTIYRMAEADLLEEMIYTIESETSDSGSAESVTRKQPHSLRSPQNLPISGSLVYEASHAEITRALGLSENAEYDLYIGDTTSGTPTKVVLKRESIQRHMFICGTTGSGKSYAMGVVAEELMRHGLPVIFLDTQDEYSQFVKLNNGTVVVPGQDFTIRISSLTESELLDLLPEAMKQSALQSDIVAKAFGQLQVKRQSEEIAKFTLDDLLTEIEDVAPAMVAKAGDLPRVIDTTKRRTSTLKNDPIFGSGTEKSDWRQFMYPCMAINCKNLTSAQLQSIATAVLRELQNLRLKNHIPPYVMVIDEAHLFVPNDTGSPCKQIIREGVRIGRHHGICLVLMTQSPVDIDKSVIRQCNTRLVFALEPDQLDAIRGVKADASEELLRALPKMPRGTCLVSGTYESIKHTIPVKIRERTLEDSEGGKTPDIFADMKDNWTQKISALKAKRQTTQVSR